MKTGWVSPSYRNTYDDKYATVTKAFGKYVLKSEWQVKCGFKQDPTMPLLTIDRVKEVDINVNNQIPEVETNDLTIDTTNELTIDTPLDIMHLNELQGDIMTNQTTEEGIEGATDTIQQPTVIERAPRNQRE
jgi:hypothetical protein